MIGKGDRGLAQTEEGQGQDRLAEPVNDGAPGTRERRREEAVNSPEGGNRLASGLTSAPTMQLGTSSEGSAEVEPTIPFCARSSTLMRLRDTIPSCNKTRRLRIELSR